MLNLIKATNFNTYRTSGHSSVVERLVANEKVEGSTPFARSKKLRMNDLLNKKFKFKNFLESQNFINKVGEISENEGHHPDISFGWGYAEIKITTHAIEGLSKNDFILAAKIDQLINV